MIFHSDRGSHLGRGHRVPLQPRPRRLLSLAALREEALEARNDPAKENAFRQYRLNQWVAQSTRWMPIHLYHACTGTEATDPARLRERHAGRAAWAVSTWRPNWT